MIPLLLIIAFLAYLALAWYPVFIVCCTVSALYLIVKITIWCLLQFNPDK